MNEEIIYCACGCGRTLMKFDNRGRERKYIWGHNKPWLNKTRPQKTKEKLRLANLGKHHSLETKKKMSKAHSGKNNHFYGKRHSSESIRKIRDSNFRNPRRYWLNKKRVEMSGDKHPNWQGGITPLNKKMRYCYEGKQWRKRVLERDKNMCVLCGSKENLEVDHIKPFSLFPEFKYKVENGRTLCRSCHRKTLTYSGKIHNYELS